MLARKDPQYTGVGMSLIPILHDVSDGVFELLWQTRCVACDMPGELLCKECISKLPWIEQRRACPNCGAPFGSLVCSECITRKEPYAAWESRSTICAMGFKGPPACIVTNLKDAHELRLAPVVAAAILTALEEAAQWEARDGLPRWDARSIDGVCFVPATRKACIRRGFDHMQLVSQAFCQQSQLPLIDVLARPSAHDRAKNLHGTITSVSDVEGARLLLLDDVITTGSSTREATRVLLAHGAQSVTVGALARVW